MPVPCRFPDSHALAAGHCESGPPNSSLRLRQHPPHPFRQSPPALLLGVELPPPFRSNRIESRLPILFRLPPLPPNPTVLLHSVQRRIERSLLNPQQLVRNP